MGTRLRVIPFIALVAAAVDTLLVRRAFDHRPVTPDLFVQAFALWLVFAVLALVPASFCAARRRRARPDAEPEPTLSVAVRMAAWTWVPVLVHARLDAYTSIGGNVAAFLSIGPWAELAMLALATVLVLRFVRPQVARLPALPVGLVVAVLSIAAGLLLPIRGERTVAQSRTGAAASGGPNVLLLIWDTARSKSLALTGYERSTTPNLDRLAEDALVFTNARSVSSYTLTSHLSMLTGVYPSHHGARMIRQRFDPHLTPPVAQDFLDAGYRTGAFVGTGVLRAQTGIEWGFEVFEDQVDPPVCDTYAWGLVHDVQSLAAKVVPALEFNGLPHWIQDFQRPASEVLDGAAAWIDNGDPRPWFCMVNMYDVHWPYLPSDDGRERWVREYGGPIDGYLKRSNSFEEDYLLDDDDHRHLTDLYDGEMYELDAVVDAFLGRIDLAAGDTAVVVTSDHGEAFGEHGRYEHDDILEPQLRIPMLVRPAGGTAGQRIDTPVNGIDVTPTLLELAGLSRKPFEGAASFTGRSLLTIQPGEQRLLLVEDRDHLDPTDMRFALYSGHWKLVRRGLDEEQKWYLVDLRSPEEELTDRSEDHPQVFEDLKQRFDELRAAWGADDEADLETGGGDSNAAALEALGYLEATKGEE